MESVILQHLSIGYTVKGQQHVVAADLNAAYNIGARYFVRELCREFPDEILAPILAEVPGVAHRSQCTLSSLWMLSKALVSWSEQAAA